MDDGEHACAAVDSPNRKVKVTHVTDEDTLRGMLKEAEEVVNQCTPVLEIIQGPRMQLGQRMTSLENPASASGGGCCAGEHVQSRYIGVKA